MIVRIKKLLASLRFTRLTFFVLGIGSTVWFLIRVIPKPSRAAYPCMRVSAPIMSSFVLYLIGLGSTVYIFRNNKGRLVLLKGVLALVFVVSLLISFQLISPVSSQFTMVDPSYFQANTPMGIANGVFPGRVVWIYNPDAVNEKLSNQSGDFWYMDNNCNQALVDSMLSSGIRRIGGKANLRSAWDQVFKYFNETHGRSPVGYRPGEKFAIKINLTNSYGSSIGTERMDASPQMVLGILKQLIEVVKVPQTDIWIGDNYRLFRDDYWNKCHSVYPNVHYVDGKGANGREQTKPSADQLLVFSDGKETSSIPQHYLDATYLINMPCLKSHETGGITIAAKNHQGSILSFKSANGNTPDSQLAMYMHYCLPGVNNQVNQYRHLVDYMGHQELGGKTLIYIVDGLWAGKSSSGIVEKWQMAPFNNDYPSSLFLSQDAVAIESVCFDFLLAEYAAKPEAEKYPYMIGVDDYMKQVADPANWPSDINYDPENDGTLLKSLGVYEHWNNATEMKYSRNLGTGNGIELLKYQSQTLDTYKSEIMGLSPQKTIGFKLYPNPFSESIRIDAGNNQKLNLQIFNLNGQLVFSSTMTGTFIWKGASQNGSLPKGAYLVRLTNNNTGELVWTEKIIYDRK